MPVVTVVVVPVDIVGIEVDVPRVVRVVRIEGRRPVVAVGARIVEIGIVPVASGGKELPYAGRLTGGCVPPLSFSEDNSPDGPDFIEFTPHSADSAYGGDGIPAAPRCLDRLRSQFDSCFTISSVSSRK